MLAISQNVTHCCSVTRRKKS